MLVDSTHKFSIVELSQQSPLQLMDERTPQSAKAVWKPVLHNIVRIYRCARQLLAQGMLYRSRLAGPRHYLATTYVNDSTQVQPAFIWGDIVAVTAQKLVGTYGVKRR